MMNVKVITKTHEQKNLNSDSNMVIGGKNPCKKPSQTITDMFAKLAKKKKSNCDEKNESLSPDPPTNDNTDDESHVGNDKENHNPQLNDNQNDDSCAKKIKIDGNGDIKEQSKIQPKKPVHVEKCKYCCQKMIEGEIQFYPGHPNGAVDEQIALTDPRLCLFTGDEDDVNENDIRPQNKLTYFSVYDQEGHLCAFDSGLIEKNVSLFLSGYMKPIYDENPSPDDGVAASEIGPILEWYVSGFDGGQFALIGIITEFGEYILMEPLENYESFMNTVKEKIYMSKLVIEFLLDEISPTYEDLLNRLETAVPPRGTIKFTEDSLMRHAQFVCDQITSFDESARNEDALLITSPCIRALANLTGVTLGRTQTSRRTQRKAQNLKKPIWTKATTTPLVSEMFEQIFNGQLANEKDLTTRHKRHRCGVCENCQRTDCGVCIFCKDMIKFGGSGKSKQACQTRLCPNMAIQEEDDLDLEENEEDLETIEPEYIELKDFKELKRNVEWVSDPIKEENYKTYYDRVLVSDTEIKLNDCVLIEPKNPAIPLHIARVVYMWEDKKGQKMFHANWFCRSTDTLLGETSDPKELFLCDECANLPLSSVKSTTTVNHHEIPDNWGDMGNLSLTKENEMKDREIFFYQKQYTRETCRFEDPFKDPPNPGKDTSHRYCASCIRIGEAQYAEMPRVFDRIEKKDGEVLYDLVKYKGEEYRVGNAVYLNPKAFKFQHTFTYPENSKEKQENVDEDLYPEYYRKSSDNVKGSNYDVPEPFHIGYINRIYATTDDKLVPPSQIRIKINKMYRPENTHRDPLKIQHTSLNMLYWSDEVCDLKFSKVVAKCYLTYSENLTDSADDWCKGGPSRFYFTESYNAKTQTFDDPPHDAMCIGKQAKTKDKGKSKSKKPKNDRPPVNEAKDHFWIPRKLRTFDVFAGCGGLSEGLHQSGISENLWAIEKEEPAAHAYRMNNPNATVFTEDCNVMLQKVMEGALTDDRGQKLPQKGQVELLCGGPPCQGFSGMNRFNCREYSRFKNSLIVAFLSFCDFYRPRFFIMENVRNFVTFKNSMILKLTLRCLVHMGYQCTYGILQAGNYGVPQTRRRMIILAAAPGEILPKFPEPTHVFSKRACQLSVVVDNKKYSTNCKWTESAPLRTITVRDAMSDLPDIKNGWQKEEMPYNCDPLSHFQRQMRGKHYQPMLRDHVCKEMQPLVEARMSHIPTASGSDWRDLPNIEVRLSDGTYTKKLEYNYHTGKPGESSTGRLRGVCSCSTGKPCDPTDRQFNTLIPWCLPHTGNRHNHWAGLYGRLEWDGFFSTTITNPEPMGKQGRVLHPSQTRLVSVRECARSQGFPDSFRFFGNVLDMHRQVGNAVPPPLGAAIGHEIRKSLSIQNTLDKLDTPNTCDENVQSFVNPPCAVKGISAQNSSNVKNECGEGTSSMN